MDEPDPLQLIRPLTAVARLWDKYSGEGRSIALIEKMEREDLHQLYIEFAQIKKHVGELQAEMERDAAHVVKSAEEFSDATFGASPNRKAALRRLTLGRFDPRVERDLRDLWFDRAKGLKDHEIHGILTLREGPVSFWLVQPWAFRGSPRAVQEWQRDSAGEQKAGTINMTRFRIPWSAEVLWDMNSILFYLAKEHGDLVERLTVDSQLLGYQLTEHGRRLVAAVGRYDDVLGRVAAGPEGPSAAGSRT